MKWEMDVGFMERNYENRNAVRELLNRNAPFDRLRMRIKRICADFGSFTTANINWNADDTDNADLRGFISVITTRSWHDLRSRSSVSIR